MITKLNFWLVMVWFCVDDGASRTMLVGVGPPRANRLSSFFSTTRFTQLQLREPQVLHRYRGTRLALNWWGCTCDDVCTASCCSSEIVAGMSGSIMASFHSTRLWPILGSTPGSSMVPSRGYAGCRSCSAWRRGASCSAARWTTASLTSLIGGSVWHRRWLEILIYWLVLSVRFSLSPSPILGSCSIWFPAW